jgi:hypothetical protein
MYSRELVENIRSGPAKLVLRNPLPRFRRRTRSYPCDFNEFLQALQSSETIRWVECESHRKLNISEDEWVLLVKTLGNIKGITDLQFNCVSVSHNFHPFQAVANAVNNAQSLCALSILLGVESLPIDPSGLAALANALREHTTLKDFFWADPRSRTDPDLVLRALPECPHLRKVTILTIYAIADAMKNLIQLAPATKLHLMLKMDQWLAVADEIRHGRCNVQWLHLTSLEGTISATDAVKALASAIRLNRNLEHLHLRMDNGYTDEAGVALAEALTVNKTLRQVLLCVAPVHHRVHQVRNRDNLGAQAYEAFSAMLRVNTSLDLTLPPFESAGADERLLESRQQMFIELQLNRVGRGRLVKSRQTTREEWVDALRKLNFTQFDDSPPLGVYNLNDSPAFRVSCLYSLLRLNPSVVCVP